MRQTNGGTTARTAGGRKLGKKMDDVIFWTGLISEQSRKRYKKQSEEKSKARKEGGGEGPEGYIRIKRHEQKQVEKLSSLAQERKGFPSQSLWYGHSGGSYVACSGSTSQRNETKKTDEDCKSERGNQRRNQLQQPTKRKEIKRREKEEKNGAGLEEERMKNGQECVRHRAGERNKFLKNHRLFFL
jgi:hypothetical protein